MADPLTPIYILAAVASVGADLVDVFQFIADKNTEKEKSEEQKTKLPKLGDSELSKIGFCGRQHGKTGKNTLLNALRGMETDGSKPAPTGIMETANQLRNYKLHWATDNALFEVSEDETPEQPKKSYIYPFDYLYIIYGEKLTETDIEVAKDAAFKYKIPISFIRSHCDEELRKLKPVDSEITKKIKEKFRKEAKEVFMSHLPEEVREKVEKLFLVSGPEMLKVVKGEEESSEFSLDEKELLQHIQGIRTNISNKQKEE